MTVLRLFLSLWLLLAAAPALAQDPVEQAQAVELERVRARVAGQIHLTATDLVDEMVFGWSEAPPFSAPTPVVLAGVSVPVGLGTGMQALLENHLSNVITQNPTTNVQLVHCPSCTAVVVHSGPEGTVVSRGIDNPEVLAELGDTGGKHALFIDVEAEGAWLVLRARLTRLTEDLPIVWSHTIAASASVPALLREPDALKSAADARQEYLSILQDKRPIIVPLRFTVRAYASGFQGVPPPPFLWLQSGVELAATDARLWTSSILVGYTFIPQAYQGIMIQSRVNRLITGRSRAMTRPNLYAFVGAAAISVWGPATASFREQTLNADELLADIGGEGPRNTFGALHTGLDLRIGNRIGLSAFLETMPALNNSNNLGAYLYIGNLPLQSFGTEVTVCF